MTEKDRAFKQKYLKLFFKKQNTRSSFKKLLNKHQNNYLNYISKVNKVFNPLLLKINNNPEFLYKISTKKFGFEVYYINNNKEELILELYIKNLLIPQSKSLIGEIDIDLNFYKNTNINIEKKLKCLILVGDISKYLIKDKAKIISKLTSLSNNLLKKQLPLKSKIFLLQEKYVKEYNIVKNYHAYQLFEYLNKGVELNLTHPLIEKPYSLSSKITPPIQNIKEVKLINSKEIKFTHLNNLNNLATTTLKRENLLTFIKDEFLSSPFIEYITYPKIYPEIVHEINSLT